MRSSLVNHLWHYLPPTLPDHEERQITGADMRLFRSGRNIFLSPHFDDICFSLGALVNRVRSGLLVNIFTHGNFVAPRGDGAAPLTPAEVRAIRSSEDSRFAEAVGLAFVDLGLEEPSLRGRGSRDLRGLADDLGQALEPVHALLASEFESASGQAVNIFCPAGIGNHVNHVVMMKLMTAQLDRLKEDARVFFYEDLPYSASAGARRRGLSRLIASAPGYKAVRIVSDIAEQTEQKLRLMGCYPTQIHPFPKDLRRFSLSTRAFAAPHEALWEFRAVK